MDDRQLLYFSIAFGLWAMASILIPYFRRQHDLLTARNFFLVGAMLYVGFSGVKAATEAHFYDYPQRVLTRYMAYIVLFFFVFSLAYKKIRWPSRVGSRRFLNWPMETGLGVWFPMLLTMAAMTLQMGMVQVPGLRVAVTRIGLIAPAFCLVFALTIWRQSKLSPMGVFLVAFSFFCGGYLAFASGGGRRFLYAVVVAIPVCAYWWKLRYRKPIVTLAIFAAFLVLAPIGDSAYRAARWYGHFGASRNLEVGASTRWQMFKDALFRRDESMSQATLQIGQTTAENMLLITYIFNEGSALFPEFHVKPLHSLYVMMCEPIPRVFWADKPFALGLTLPFDSKVLGKQVRTNWGPGIIGHTIHDGGVITTILYAVLLAMMLRFIDELLVRHPSNPFLLGFLSSASVNIAGIIRGDLATMVPLVLLAFVFMLLLAWATRMVVGTERTLTELPSPSFLPGRAYR